MPTITTRRKMGWFALAFHWTMTLCTVGLWAPMFLAARRRRVTKTYVPDALAPQPYPQAYPQQAYQQPGYPPQPLYTPQGH